MSTAALGDLVVRLAADIASFEGAMNRAEMLTAKTAEGIESAMDKAGDSVKKLAEAYIGFEAIKAFANSVDDATKFASSLELLSQRIGISVEDMSAFKNIAEKSGTTLQTVAQGLSMLQRSMYDTMQGTGKAKIVFDSLNLSVTNGNGTLKDAKAFFEELSQKIAGLGSATERSAAAQKVMRGVGSELLPLMLALAQGGELEAEVTTKQALEAKHYTDSLVDLHDIHEKFFRTISQRVTPVMEALVRGWVDLSTQAGSLSERTKQLAAQNQLRQWAIDAAIGVTMVVDGLRYVAVGIQIVLDAVKILATSAVTGFEIIVGALGTAFASLQDLGTLMRGVAEIFAGDFVAGVADVNAAVDGMKAGWGGFFEDSKAKAKGLSTDIDGLANDIKSLMAGFKQGAATEALLTALDAINNRVDKLRTGAKGAGDSVKEFKKGAIDALIDSLDKEKAKLEANIQSYQETGGAAQNLKEIEVLTRMNEDDWIQTINRLAKERKSAGETEADWIHRMQTAVIVTAQRIDQDTIMLRIIQDRIKADLAAADAQGKAVQNLQDQIDRQKEANATFGLATGAVADYNIALLENRRRIAEQYDSSQEVVDALNAQIAKWRELKAVQISGHEMEDSINGWKDLSQIIGSTASSAIMNWGHAVQSLRDMFKGLLADMIKIFMQKWALNMVANVVGGSGSQMGASLLSAASQIGKGTFAGSIYDYFSGPSNVGQFGPPDTPGGYSDTYFNNPGSSGPGAMGYAGGAAGGAVAGYGYGSFIGQMLGNDRNQTGMSVGGAVGGAAGMVAGMALGAEYGSIAGPIGMIIGAIIGALIGGLVSSGGAEKLQGSFEGAFTGDAQGATLHGGALPQTTIDLFSGSNQNSAAAQKLTQNIADSIYKAAATLGGKDLPGMQVGFGFSTDPGGTAPGMIHSVLRDSSGNIVYQHNNDDAPRDNTQFQSEVALEEERVLVAGLQNLDLGPDMNALFDSFGDITTATKEDLDALLAKAVDLKGAIDIINAVGQGPHAISLTVDDIKGYQEAGESLSATASRVGGAWVNLVSAFEDPMEKLNGEKSNLAQLYGTLQASGYQVPKTRADWLKIMESIDQSTAAGRSLFMQMLQLSGSFDDVTNASKSMMDQFDEFMGQTRPGYTTGMQQQTLGTDVSQFMANNPWTNGMTPGEVIAALHTISREDFSHYDTATQALILSILKLDTSINGNTNAVAQSTAAQIDLTAYTSATYDAFLSKYDNEMNTRFGEVISNSPDHATQFTNQIGISQDLIKEFKARQEAIEHQYQGFAMPAEWYALQTAINNLDASLPGLSKKLAAVTILEAQYGKQKGDQLFDLQEWYDQQKALVGDNQAALLALEKEYQDKRTAIMNGATADGVADWQKGIQSFLDSLLTNQQLSPLSLQDQLAAARDNYEKTLAAANGGDTTAQGQLQSVAEAYLNIARSLGASGPLYNDIFRTVYDELAKASKGQTYEQRMAAVLPDSGKLASQADINTLKTSVDGLTEVLLKGISVSDPEVTSILTKALAAAAAGGKGIFA